MNTSLIDELQRLENEFGGHLGLAAKNLRTGEVIAFNSTERFPTASVIKLPIMVAFFDLVEQRKLDPETRISLQPDDKKPGLVEFLSDGMTLTLLDAVKLMIVLSENTTTNLVLDRFGHTHEERLKVVNDVLVKYGLKHTKLLNRLYTLSTKQQTPEAIRYGIGVSTPEDMVLLMEKLYNKTLVSPSASEKMLEILKRQQYHDMIPRMLPQEQCATFDVAHKTGWVQESKIDVALVLTDRVEYAIAVFIDKHPDHQEDLENRGVLLGAYASRAIWNHFTGDNGYTTRTVTTSHVDWNSFPGGSWLIYRSPASLFPHKDRLNGLTKTNGAYYPYLPHYADSSIVIVVPSHFKETDGGTNLIVHFHGHMNDNMGVLEHHRMSQALVAQKTNAIFVLPQGPYRARDSFGGKMEDINGLKNLVEDVLRTLTREKVIKSPTLNKLTISAHSGGYRPAAFAIERGGLTKQITNVFLFDALYGYRDHFRRFMEESGGTVFAAYTEHLAKEHIGLQKEVATGKRSQLHVTPTAVPHDEVVQNFFPEWLSLLGREWKLNE